MIFIFGLWLEINFLWLLFLRMFMGKGSSGYVYRVLNCVINKCGWIVRVENVDVNVDL